MVFSWRALDIPGKGRPGSSQRWIGEVEKQTHLGSLSPHREARKQTHLIR
jgi:hypothetical protein